MKTELDILKAKYELTTNALAQIAATPSCPVSIRATAQITLKEANELGSKLPKADGPK